MRPSLPLAATLAAAASLAGAKTISGDWIRVDVDDSNKCDVTAFGAVGDGSTDDTNAFSKALSACASGGEVVVPAPGVYRTWNVSLDKATNMGINVEPGATWTFFNDTKSPKWGGCGDVIRLTNVNGVALYGGGTIDGNGGAWWPNPDAYRPGMLYASGQELLITGLTFVDSPNHNLQLYAANTEVVDTTILAPPSGSQPGASHNTDGIDVHAPYMWIHRCNITTGDDNIAFHANHTLVNDCYFGTGHGASIGSLGGPTWLTNITVRDVDFVGTTQAMRIKADCGSSGRLWGVQYGPNITCTDVGQTIYGEQRQRRCVGAVLVIFARHLGQTSPSLLHLTTGTNSHPPIPSAPQ